MNDFITLHRKDNGKPIIIRKSEIAVIIPCAELDLHTRKHILYTVIIIRGCDDIELKVRETGDDIMNQM